MCFEFNIDPDSRVGKGARSQSPLNGIFFSEDSIPRFQGFCEKSTCPRSPFLNRALMLVYDQEKEGSKAHEKFFSDQTYKCLCFFLVRCLVACQISVRVKSWAGNFGRFQEHEDYVDFVNLSGCNSQISVKDGNLHIFGSKDLENHIVVSLLFLVVVMHSSDAPPNIPLSIVHIFVGNPSLAITCHWPGMTYIRTVDLNFPHDGFMENTTMVVSQDSQNGNSQVQ